MHPAFSVIFLTTLIGTGQGLFLALFTVESYAAFGLLPAQADGFYALGTALALAFLAAGLVASFFHLGRPERAWRSAAQWRTSWLSREVLALPAFMGTVSLYGIAHFAGFNPVLATLPSAVPVSLTFVLGTAGTALAFVLFLCTGMIYACLRFLREWHTPLTVINYVLLGGASGFTLAAAFSAAVAPELVAFLAGWALAITLLGLAGRAASLVRNARLKPKSTLQTAIGIKHPMIAQKSQGFMGGSFNTREFFHARPPEAFRLMSWLFLPSAFAIPALLLMAGMSAASAALLLAAFIVQIFGLIAERWYFFAQASHPQNLYYQSAG
ncbi:MAG: dimethyl sulfoxide reductase anchor subunit [Candidatus Nitricoxidivorans perseverans]|uniref:Dimethyl sulfoxide reductase anchor subunit n=1 Tax=Candidatus Nitricoxidivorans perseverans TaxID=2975601 RepID=A0AA49FKH0_9PROT|nr:MAG: dimethyl sulfoxide reductase anchor subunit [Candidatus Nitricoxidivorans perseverans]